MGQAVEIAAAGQRRAFISGITGQDGSYLTEHLLSAGWTVHGMIRRSSITARPRIDRLQGNPSLHLHYGDVLDASSCHRLLREIQPHHVYHLAAMSHVAVSFEVPAYTSSADYLGTLNMLEAFRAECPASRFYNACSSEIFGSSPPPQNESTPFAPCSPYGVAKLAGYWLCRRYREAYGLWVSNGILFNHESPRRGESFVSRKITRGVARLALGLTREPIRLGNIDAVRDWMHAKDAVRAMVMMLEWDEPDDFVIASGRGETVKRFLVEAFRAVGIDAGFGLTSSAVCISGNLAYGKKLAVIDPAYCRPSEVAALIGDASRARQLLNWQPTVTLEELVREMVESDLAEARREMAGNG